MATPERPRRGEARERILKAASALFYQKGFRGVGIDEIVERSGVTKMTLYKHFASKDQLIAEFLRRRDQWWQEWFTSTVEQRAVTPGERLLAVFDVLGEWFQSPGFRGCAFINAVAELADCEHPGHTVSLEHKEVVHTYLRRMSAETGVSDPQRLAYQLMLLVEGAIVMAQMGAGLTAARNARDAASVLLESAVLEAAPELESGNVGCSADQDGTRGA